MCNWSPRRTKEKEWADPIFAEMTAEKFPNQRRHQATDWRSTKHSKWDKDEENSKSHHSQTAKTKDKKVTLGVGHTVPYAELVM